jgi:hypothetical protein
MPRLEMRVGEMTPPPAGKVAVPYEPYRSTIQLPKPAEKRLCCKTCDGRGCKGRCKF